MLTRRQRLLAFALYMKRPARAFVPVLFAFCLLLLGGGVAFHQLYSQEPLGLLRGVYITYALVFMEHLLPFPEHLLLQVLYVALPPLGLAVILDGIVQFSLRILRRDAASAEWNRAMTRTLQDHVILCGLGKAGIRTLEYLLQLGQKVVVLEKDPRCPNLAFARNHGVPTHIGGGREEGIFEALNTRNARSIVVATDDDLANIEMVLDARRLNPDIHVVLRVFDQELASRIRENFDIEVALSTTAVSAPLFATAATDPSIINAFTVEDQLLVVARIRVEAYTALTGERVRELAERYPLYVLSRVRGEETLHRPPGDERIRAGDRLVIQTDPQTLEQIHAANIPEKPSRRDRSPDRPSEA